MNRVRLTVIVVLTVFALRYRLVAQDIAVVEPVAGFHGQSGTTISVSWTGLSHSVPIRISRWAAGDGKWSVVISGYRSNDSRFEWYVPFDAPLGAYRIKVEDIESGSVGISNSFFYIETAAPPVGIQPLEQESFAVGNLNMIASDTVLSLYPNLSAGYLRVESAQSGMTEVKVVTVHGSEVVKVRMDHSSSSTIVELPANLPSGRYLTVVRYIDHHVRIGSFDIVK